VQKATEMLDQMQKDLFAKAKKFRDDHTFVVNSWEEFEKKVEDGFLLAHWCEDAKCEAQGEEKTNATTRNRPFDLKQEKGKCVLCGKDSPGRIVFSKAY
jgi:prolyl-tRNA synthetase